MSKRKADLADRQRSMKEWHAPSQSLADLRDEGIYCFEPHFTPKELAGFWKLNETTVRRLVQDEPGVLKLGKPDRRDGKRDYISLRVPRSVAMRVHRERSK